MKASALCDRMTCAIWWVPVCITKRENRFLTLGTYGRPQATRTKTGANMPRPVCSIIIPTRNCLNYLPTTLASIDRQALDGLEVILVDEGSSDGTADWARARPVTRFALTVLETGGIGRSVGVA